MKPDPKKYKLYESAMIKSIRRGQRKEAVSFAGALCLLGLEKIVWRRIFIHMSEDIGPANPTLPSNIHALYESYKLLTTESPATYESSNVKFLPIAHAVLLLAYSYKSRGVENALICEFDENTWHEMEIPDYVIDFHSPKGRRMGRDAKHFIEEAGKIQDEATHLDLWKERAENILLKKDQ